MNFNRPLILASKSPRRRQLLRDCGFRFDTVDLDVDESFDPQMDCYEVAKYLSTKKADAYQLAGEKEIVVTADTVVIFENEILGKPESREQALEILLRLSGNTHDVVTGVTIKSSDKNISLDDLTTVTFKKLTRASIEYYIDNFSPYDKAGSYGAQDWWGLVAIEKLEGSYFNVMGLPTHKVYPALMSFNL